MELTNHTGEPTQGPAMIAAAFMVADEKFVSLHERLGTLGGGSGQAQMTGQQKHIVAQQSRCRSLLRSGLIFVI